MPSNAHRVEALSSSHDTRTGPRRCEMFSHPSVDPVGGDGGRCPRPARCRARVLRRGHVIFAAAKSKLRLRKCISPPFGMRPTQRVPGRSRPLFAAFEPRGWFTTRFPDSTQSRVPAGTPRRRDALLLTGRFPRFAFFAGCAQHIFSAPVEQQCPRCAPTRDATARGNCRVRTRPTDAPNAGVGETRGGKTPPRGGCPEGINCQNSVPLGAKIWFWPAARPPKRR